MSEATNTVARKHVRHRSDCRLCGAKNFELVLPILPSPIGDAFVPASRLSEPQDVYPLDTYLCLECGHLQNLDIVDPDILFREYTYRTSVSLGLVKHFEEYARSAVETLGLKPGVLVAEMGSNDGSLLKAFKAHGMRVQGIDPAIAIAASATEAGIPTLGDFFSAEVARKLRGELGPATLFCANNVFAHVDDMNDIVAGIRHLLADDGCFSFEVSYVPHLIDNMVFDTIYHEHVSHHALGPLERFLNRHDLTLFDALIQASKGGSVRGFAQVKSKGERARTSRLMDLYKLEEHCGIEKPQIYRDFYKRIEERKRATLKIVDAALADGKTIAAYGASTTTTTLLYHFELQGRVSYIVDDNPIKQGMFSPGKHLPVYPSSELLTRKPDLVVILAWMYARPIVEKSAAYLAQGGKMIAPLPETRIILA